MKKILLITLCLLVFLVASSYAISAKEQMQGYALNNAHCISCHDSVADCCSPF